MDTCTTSVPHLCTLAYTSTHVMVFFSYMATTCIAKSATAAVTKQQISPFSRGVASDSRRQRSNAFLHCRTVDKDILHPSASFFGCLPVPSASKRNWWLGSRS